MCLYVKKNERKTNLFIKFFCASPQHFFVCLDVQFADDESKDILLVRGV
jgi:hypothetical protein